MIRRRYISVRLLEPGMVIDQVFVDKIGRILIARNTTLDAFLIRELRKMGISGIYIREGSEEETEADNEISPRAQEVIEKLQMEDRGRLELSESVKKRVSEGVQFLYSNTSDKAFVDTVNHISGELMKAISENDAVALNIDALKVSDEYTFKHSVDVAAIAMVIAKHNQMSREDIYQIGMAGLLHDVGKSRIPEAILNKPDRLTEQEFEIMKRHSVYGYRILQEKQELPRQVLLGVLQHHEKIDGTGYPLGVKEGEIGIYARILAVADIYDALVTERPYKKGFSQRDAVELLMTMTGELDIGVMRSFLNSVILYPVGSIVSLSNGERARVVKNSLGYPLRPKVVGIRNGRVYDLSEDIRCASMIIE